MRRAFEARGNLGSIPFRALSSQHLCSRSPGLLNGDGRLSAAAAAAAVTAARAAPTVRALGSGALVGSWGPRKGTELGGIRGFLRDWPWVHTENRAWDRR